MKKILNWIVVIVVAFIITGLVCRAKIYDGMTEIKHIYNGMTPIYSIYDGPGVATGASNITFSTALGIDQFIYNIIRPGAPRARGSSSISNNNLAQLRYYPVIYSQIFRRLKYNAVFNTSFLKQKFPISISIDDSSYNVFFDVVDYDSDYLVFITNIIPTKDQVTSTDLTKTIDFDLVDNEQVTFTSQTQTFNLTEGEENFKIKL